VDQIERFAEHNDLIEAILKRNKCPLNNIYSKCFDIHDPSSYIYKLLNFKKEADQKIVILAPGDSPSKIAILLQLLYGKLLKEHSIEIVMFPLSGKALDSVNFNNYMRQIVKDYLLVRKNTIFGYIDAQDTGHTKNRLNSFLKSEGFSEDGFSEDLFLNVIGDGDIFDVAERCVFTAKGKKINARCILKYDDPSIPYDNIEHDDVTICNMILIYYYNLFKNKKN
jgi:hypothetical protein